MRTLEDADGKPGALLMPENIPVPMPKPDVVPTPSVIPSPQDNNPSGDNAKEAFGVILNKIEESDDPYSQGEGRNDFYRLEIKKGDKLIIVLESDDFKPVIIGGYGTGGNQRPKHGATWKKEEPHNRAEVAFTTDRDGHFAFAVHADADFKDGGKGAYRLWFTLNGKFLKASANITAAGGEGAETVILNRDDIFMDKNTAGGGDPTPLPKDDSAGGTVGNFAGFQPAVRIYNLPNSFPSQTVGDKDGDLIWLRKEADEGFRFEVKSKLTLGDSGKEKSKTVVAVTHRFQNSNCVYLMSYSVGKEVKYPFDFGAGGASITASKLSIEDEAKTPTNLFVNTKFFGKNSTVQRIPKNGYYSRKYLPKKWGVAEKEAKIQLSDIEAGEIQVFYVGVFNYGDVKKGRPLTSVSLPVGDQQKMSFKTGNPDWDVNLISTVRKRVGGNISELYIGQNPFFQLGALIAVTRHGDELFFTCFCVDGKIKRTARDGNYPTRVKNLAGDYEAKFSERSLKPGQSGEFQLKGLGVSNANISSN